MFPENLVQACFQQVATIYVPKKDNIIPPTAESALDNSTAIMTTMAAITTEAINATNGTINKPEMVRSLEFKDGMNVLGAYFWLNNSVYNVIKGARYKHILRMLNNHF